MYRNKDNPRQSHTFEIRLDEDLYFYLNHTGKIKSYPSKCTVTKECNDNLSFFEELYTFSVSNLYEKTFIYYFAHHGSPAANAYDKIYVKSNNGVKTYLRAVRDNVEKRLKQNK